MTPLGGGVLTDRSANRSAKIGLRPVTGWRGLQRHSGGSARGTALSSAAAVSGLEGSDSVGEFGGLQGSHAVRELGFEGV